MSSSFRLRAMTPSDIRGVLDVERKSGCEEIWGEEAFRVTLGRKKRGALVASEGKQILGFLCYQGYRETNVILRLAIRPSVRRQRIATKLVNYLMTAVGTKIRPNLSIHVRESNLPAQLFLKSFGFRCTKTVKDYYKHPPEDAFLFRYSLP